MNIASAFAKLFGQEGEKKGRVIGKISAETLEEFREVTFLGNQLKLEFRAAAPKLSFDLANQFEEQVRRGEFEQYKTEFESQSEEQSSNFSRRGVELEKRRKNVWRLIAAELGVSQQDIEDLDYSVDITNGAVEIYE